MRREYSRNLILSPLVLLHLVLGRVGKCRLCLNPESAERHHGKSPGLGENHSTDKGLIDWDFPGIQWPRLCAAEPWDVGPNGYRLGQFPQGWSEQNDQFRDTVRRFWRGDKGLIGKFATRIMGSRDIFTRDHRSINASVNYIYFHSRVLYRLSIMLHLFMMWVIIGTVDEK